VTNIVRASCLFVALVCFFFGAYYIFADQWVTGLWAIVSGILLMFVREFIVIDDEDDED
jgi:hypothetical protein